MPFVCLANSKKRGGSCIAGKDTVSKAWVRPVPSQQGGAWNIIGLDVLDEFSFPSGNRVPLDHQTENVLAQPGNWQIRSRNNFGAIRNMLDRPQAIWRFPGDTHQDRVSFAKIQTMGVANSLYLIEVQGMLFHYAPGARGRMHLKSKFAYNGFVYDFSVTDPMVDTDLSAMVGGNYRCVNPINYVCISLGENYNGFCYKLIASVICEERYAGGNTCDQCNRLVLQADGNMTAPSWDAQVIAALQILIQQRTINSASYIATLNELGVVAVDKRYANGGNLWIQDTDPRLGRIIRNLNAQGANFIPARGGAIDYEQGWYTK